MEERVGVADEVEDDGEFVGEIAAADELFDDNVVADVVDGEAAPPTLSAPNGAAVPNAPVVAAPPAVSKPRDVEDIASSPCLSISAISMPMPMPIFISICWRCTSKSIIGKSGVPTPSPISS